MENFTWVSVYNKIAHKILEYKNRNSEFVSLVYKILEDAGVMVSEEKGCNLDSDGVNRFRYEEMDPISFMNRFNMYKKSTSEKIINEFQKNTGMKIELPLDYDGIPTTNPQTSMVIRFKVGREKEDVPNIWELFNIALTGDMNKLEDRNKFIKYYDKVVSKKQASYNISIGLFKIRPDEFLNLDSTNREYINKNYGIKISHCPSGKEYLNLINVIKNELKKSNKTLLDFSKDAWEKNEKIIEEVQEVKENKNYFWINANPKIWSFSELKIGEIIEYTALNENGNKRRIYANYLNAKAGDKVIAYESTPVKCIVGICEVVDELKDGILKIKKLETLINKIPYSDLKEQEELENMEVFKNGQGSFFKLTKEEYEYILDMIREENPIVKSTFEKYTKDNFLKDVYMDEKQYNNLVNLLERKKNIILQGAPGVGKTYMAKRLAYSIMGEKNKDRIEFIQFHQSYSYEDFIEGYRPTEQSYTLEKGVFYNFCTKAKNNPDKPYFFIIDEINRGNLSKIFGELLMLIEEDKRGEKINLPYSKTEFSVPENLYIIGMMNTADRSLALIDYALRRRFAFYKVTPAFNNIKFREYRNKLNNKKLDALIEKVEELNNDICDDLSLGKGFEIGHSYFCNLKDVTIEDLKSIVEYEILPLIEEYWFDDVEKYKTWESKLNGVIND